MLREKLSGGGRSRQTATVTAHRTVDARRQESWSGTFKTRAVLTKGGKHLDTCELKRVTWSAEAVPVRLLLLERHLSVFVVLLPAASVTTAVTVSFTCLSFLNALRPSPRA